MKPLSIGYWFLCSLLFCASARGQALVYKPKADENLTRIAQIHYGDAKKLIYLSAFNYINDPNKLLSGTTLQVPTVWRYKVKKGEDLAQIAARFLKDAKRSEFIGWLNRISDAKNLKPGTDLLMPFVLRHRAAAGQSMVDIAKLYYWDDRPSALLRKFNGQRTNALQPGEIVDIPIYDTETLAEKVTERLQYYQEQEEKATKVAVKYSTGSAASENKAVIQNPPKPAANANDAKGAENPSQDPAPDAPGEGATNQAVLGFPPSGLIREAAGLYQDGEYELAQGNLSRALEKGGLSRDEEAQARELTAFCLVALDRPKEAEHEFVRLLMVDPDHSLDPTTTSPKILAPFKRAKGVR